jgi:uroporphyrinogen-III synthase
MGEQRLKDNRVLVTRPRERAQELCFLLEDEGAEVIAMPLLEMGPPDDPRPLASAAEQVHRYAWVLFTSPSAVHAFADALRQAGTRDRMDRVKVGAVGPATARTLRSIGLEPAVEAMSSSGSGLYESLKGKLPPGDQILLPIAQEGRRELEESLDEVGVEVTRVAAYKSVPQPVDPSTWEELRRRPPAIVIFASPRTAEAFLDVDASAPSLLAQMKRVAIGPTTAAALHEMGHPAQAVADKPTPVDLVEAVVRVSRIS